MPGDAQSPESSRLRQRTLGWESESSIIFAVSGVDAYVAVRCSIDSGECERIPHPVDAVGQFAR
jgi:hypothetical protein